MNFDLIIQYLGVYNHIMAILVGMPRIFMMMMVAPFFGGAVVTGQLRLVMVMSIYLIVHPAIVEALPQFDSLGLIFSLGYVLLIVKEIFIGLLLGYLAALIFWAVQAAGFFIDNQRGASQAEGADILSGESSSPLGMLFFQSITYLFFTTGGFLAFLGVVYSTYTIWPVLDFLPKGISLDLALFFASKLSWLMLNMLLLAAPITVACLLTDVSLGLMNRFASQLNVYVLAMPIKSLLASFLLCFYFAILLSYAPRLYGDIFNFIHNLEFFI